MQCIACLLTSINTVLHDQWLTDLWNESVLLSRGRFLIFYHFSWYRPQHAREKPPNGRTIVQSGHKRQKVCTTKEIVHRVPACAVSSFVPRKQVAIYMVNVLSCTARLVVVHVWKSEPDFTNAVQPEAGFNLSHKNSSFKRFSQEKQTINHNLSK